MNKKKQLYKQDIATIVYDMLDDNYRTSIDILIQKFLEQLIKNKLNYKNQIGDTMNKKFKLTSETKSWLGHTLFRIEALTNFADVKAGDKGGWVDSEDVLDQTDESWIYNDGCVYNGSSVCNNSSVNNSCVENSCVDNSRVYNGSDVDNSRVYSSSVYNSYVYSCSVCNSSADSCSVDRDINSRDSLVTVGLIGSRKGTTTYNIEANRVKCSFFSGTLEEFKKKVTYEYEEDSKYYREYQAAIQLFEVRKELFNFNDVPSKE